ncbi:MAG: nodulation protein NfeD [Burkholderiales bacterium PBB3]|nr:MAG: nodulation protein NfeD [Burkholderiales bacterium PBB3]
MRFNKLDLNLLVALDALLAERSVTKAANLLNLSPSAVSSALGRLREYFDDELLLQIGRKMEITPRAAGLQDIVRDVLLRIDCTIAVQPAFEPKASDRVFRIFASDYAQMVFAPFLLSLATAAGFAGQFEFLPQVKDPQRELERGEADLLVIPSSFMSQEHPHDVIYEEEFVCLVASGSEMATGELTYDRYVNAKHVVMHPPGYQADTFEGWFLKRYGLTRKIAVRTFGFGMLPALVSGTNCIATVHSRLAQRMVKTWPVEIRPTPVAIERMKQCIQWHKYRVGDPGIEWLRQISASASTQMGALALPTRPVGKPARLRRAAP